MAWCTDLLRLQAESRVRAPAGVRTRSTAWCAEVASVSQGGRHRRCQQWAIYQPAWSVAVAVIWRNDALLRTTRRLSGLGSRGRSLAGCSKRVLTSLASSRLRSSAASRCDCPADRQAARLLTPLSADARAKNAEPDGRMSDGTNTLATFEAKYSPRRSMIGLNEAMSSKRCLPQPPRAPPGRSGVSGNHSARSGGGLRAFRASITLSWRLDGFVRLSDGVGDVERGKLIVDILAGPRTLAGVLRSSTQGHPRDQGTTRLLVER